MQPEHFVIALGLVASPLLAGAVVLGVMGLVLQDPRRRVRRSLDLALAPRGWRGMHYAGSVPTRWVRHLRYGIVWLEAPGHAFLRAGVAIRQGGMPAGFRRAWGRLLAVADRAELRDGQLLVRVDGLDAEAIERVVVVIEDVLAAASRERRPRSGPTGSDPSSGLSYSGPAAG